MNLFKTSLLIILTALPAAGQEKEGLLNKLLAPGKLIEGHKNLESDCLKCHEAGKGVLDSKCIECHKELKKSVSTKTGFHGLVKENCIECHEDHKGRPFDSTLVDQKTFDHKKTGYILEGEHEKIRCAECHTEKRKVAKKTLRPNDPHYLGLQATCKACHSKKDPHFFEGKWAEKDCNACHGMKKWTEGTNFDHFKETKYKLEEKHTELKCAECHIRKEDKKPQYHWANLNNNQCLSCHQDQHKNNFSPKFRNGDCVKCHNQTKWTIKEFDHKAATTYPLKGSHETLDCVKCHKQTSRKPPTELKHFNFTGLKQACNSCHSDFHKFGEHKTTKLGQLSKCATCHDETKWKNTPRFSHSIQTRFEIGGKHDGLKCEKCHTYLPTAKNVKQNSLLRVYHWDKLGDKTCEVCHASPHLKTFSPKLLEKKCTECHVDTSWKDIRNKNFNHDLNTRFKLTGKHKDASCSACHSTGKDQVFKFDTAEKDFCISCHKNQHGDQFSNKFSDQKCSTCHDTSKFDELKPFDHAQTKFSLNERHADLKCAECHKAVSGKTFDQDPAFVHAKNRIFTPHAKSNFKFNGGPDYCTACHANVHRGEFDSEFNSKSCATCHNSTHFIPTKTFNHNLTSYELRGKHIPVKCAECHIATKTPRPFTKGHFQARFIFPELGTKDCMTCHKDQHKGTYGPLCSSCHTEEKWKLTSDFHKNFTLYGSHFQLQCAECHRTSQKLAGVSDNCVFCHKKDDVHQGTLGKCGTCHRQQTWELPNFKHSLTRFPLHGMHRTLECGECHRNGVYAGTTNRCQDCHQNDARAFTGNPNHTLLLNRNCAECHTQFSFK